MILDRVKAILENLGIEYCLIGGVAVAARGVARSTLDIDFLTTEKRILDTTLWEPFRAEGIPAEIHKGDFDDPLAGVVRIGAKPNQIDLVVGKWKWEYHVITRAEPVDVSGTTWPVPQVSDLILLKLAAGGSQDIIDATRLLSLGPREELIAKVDAEIAHLPKDARDAWQKLRA